MPSAGVGGVQAVVGQVAATTAPPAAVHVRTISAPVTFLPTLETLGTPLSPLVRRSAAPRDLLGPLLDDWRDGFVKQVLGRWDPTDCSLLALVGEPWLATVVRRTACRDGRRGGEAQARALCHVRQGAGLGKVEPEVPVDGIDHRGDR